MRRLLIFAIFAVLSFYVVANVAAQDTCSTFVSQALDQLSVNCGDLPRNSACYGYNNVQATFSQAFTPDFFTHPDDRVDLAALQSIETAPLDPVTSQWGIAVLKVQADLPDSLPGQAVTFLLLGDVHLTTGVEQGSDQNPMQAIYFTTGISGTKCSDAPDPSLIIQGPENITVNLRVNGADVQFGSTLIFRSGENNTMSCGVLDGMARVGAGDGQVIPAGFAARVPLDAQLNTDGDWGDNQPISDSAAAALQVLKDVPDGVLNYIPDVPTPEEVAILASLDPDLLSSYDPHELRAVVHLLIAEGVTPDMTAEWSAATLDRFIADHAEALAAALEASATEAPSAPDESGDGSAG